MSRFLECPPYGERDEVAFLAELNLLTRHHLEGCPEAARIWPSWTAAAQVEDVPYFHVGLFKRLKLVTRAPDVIFERILHSSATTGSGASQIQLDRLSSQLQTKSIQSILENYLGPGKRPLLVLDSGKSLRRPGEVTARMAAALSLRPLASDLHFLIGEDDDLSTMRWEPLLQVASATDELMVYGFTWLLWLTLGQKPLPQDVRSMLANKRILFIHSGGWKKLEAQRVDRAQFDSALLECAGPGSRVVDFYGLVEQVGIIYPLCEAGFRHAPIWADVIVRDPLTLTSLVGQGGQLQLLNIITHGGPHFSVLTEDEGRILPGVCPCGRRGKRFELLGRLPHTEVRGCANV